MNLQEEYNALSNKMMLKQTRNGILNQTDKYMLSDFPISPEQLEEVKIYRQALRDFTIDYILPPKPSFVTI
jgi:hypothetical protein